MNINGIKNIATRTWGTTKIYAKKYGPTVLMVGGVGAITVGTVKAVKVTPKAKAIWDENKATVSNIRAREDDKKTTDKAITNAYVHTLWNVTKVYGPAALWWLTGVGCVVSGHLLLLKANATLAMAYKELQEEYKNKESRFDGCDTVVDEDGNEVKVTKNEFAELKNGYSSYARLFDESNPNWKKYPGANQRFVNCQREYLQQKLEAQGHLFLNEVYDAFSIPRTAQGAIVGWYIGKDNPSENYIDFFGQKTEGAKRFIEGNERSVWLDFNVDGDILEKL